MSSEASEDAARRRTATADYRKKLLQHKELESRVRAGWIELFLRSPIDSVATFNFNAHLVNAFMFQLMITLSDA